MRYSTQKFHTANIIESKKDWIDYSQECVSSYSNKKSDRIRTATNLQRVDWDTYNLKDYIFTHNTIVASVCHDKSDSHTITEGSVPTINANENAWLNEVLGPPTSIYRTFVGAENFYEHVQDFRLSKGKVLDAVLRKVKNHAGEKVWYVDILVATHRKHRDLVSRIAKKELNTLSMGCVMSGTLVTMADGTRKKIEDIKKGEEVLSHRGKRRSVLRPIKTHWLGDVYEIHLEGRPEPIVCTGNHRFWTINQPELCSCGCGNKLPPRSRKHGKDSLNNRFVNGHKLNLINPMKKYSDEEYEQKCAILEEIKKPMYGWTEARDIQAGDYFTMSTDYEVVNSEITVGAARLLGLYLAEGSLVKQDGKYRSVEFSFSDKEEFTLAKETVELLKSEFGVKSYLYRRPNSHQCQVRTARDQSVVDWFEKHGDHYSYGKKISNKFINSPRNILKALVCGWLDGDGCLDKNNYGRMVGATVSKDLASQIGLIFTRLGISHTWKKVKAKQSIEKSGIVVNHRESYYITIPSSQVDKLISDTMRWSKEDLRPIKQRCNDNYSESYVDVRVKKIEKIRDIDSNLKLDVYCLEVEEDHSFQIAGGVGTENCLANLTTCSKCGKVMRNDWDACSHIRYEIGQPYRTSYGYESRVAELCGYPGNPDSCRFIEASWVEAPAFKGAVVNHYVSIPTIRDIVESNVLDFSQAAKAIRSISAGDIKTMKRVRVADRHSMTALKLFIEELQRADKFHRIRRIAGNLIN